jgi:hypothetical protein
VPSGCTETVGGASIMGCWPGPGEACATVADCPADYDCVPVGFGQNQCVKTTPGCNTTSDRGLGSSCEGVPGACVDRRVPCNDYTDCPKSHVCKSLPNSQFCVRVNRDCDQDSDCSDLGAPWCADIDGDGAKECSGAPQRFRWNDPIGTEHVLTVSHSARAAKRGAPHGWHRGPAVTSH